MRACLQEREIARPRDVFLIPSVIGKSAPLDPSLFDGFEWMRVRVCITNGSRQQMRQVNSLRSGSVRACVRVCAWLDSAAGSVY